MNGTNSTGEHPPSSGFLIALIIFACTCVCVGVIGNAGVIAYNVFMNHSKTPTTYFIVNLAIADIIVCIAFFPPLTTEMMKILVNTESNAKLFCKVGMTISLTSASLSIVNLLAITVDRCIFITKPLKYPRIMTWRRTYILLVGSWLLAIANVNFILPNTKAIPGRRLSCYIANTQRNIFNFINIYLPIAGLFYFNYKIYKVAKNQRKRIRNESCISSYAGQSTSAGVNPLATGKAQLRRQFKLIKTFLIVLGVFICCITPTVILSLIRRNVCKNFCVPLSVSLSAVMLVGANSVINPFIYSFRNKEYRIAYRQLISKIFRNT